MNPTEQAKLLLQISFLQRHHETHESDRIQSETDYTMIGCKRQQLRIGEDHMLEGEVEVKGNRITPK
jgi:hypothetical protein